MDWISLAQDWDKWQAAMKMAYTKRGKFLD